MCNVRPSVTLTTEENVSSKLQMNTHAMKLVKEYYCITTIYTCVCSFTNNKQKLKMKLGMVTVWHFTVRSLVWTTVFMRRYTTNTGIIRNLFTRRWMHRILHQALIMTSLYSELLCCDVLVRSVPETCRRWAVSQALQGEQDRLI